MPSVAPRQNAGLPSDGDPRHHPLSVTDLQGIRAAPSAVSTRAAVRLKARASQLCF
jgi:hypothetical protein